jgi:hypothetical protein
MAVKLYYEYRVGTHETAEIERGEQSRGIGALIPVHVNNWHETRRRER